MPVLIHACKISMLIVVIPHVGSWSSAHNLWNTKLCCSWGKIWNFCTGNDRHFRLFVVSLHANACSSGTWFSVSLYSFEKCYWLLITSVWYFNKLKKVQACWPNNWLLSIMAAPLGTRFPLAQSSGSTVTTIFLDSIILSVWSQSQRKLCHLTDVSIEAKDAQNLQHDNNMSICVVTCYLRARSHK